MCVCVSACVCVCVTHLILAVCCNRTGIFRTASFTGPSYYRLILEALAKRVPVLLTDEFLTSQVRAALPCSFVRHERAVELVSLFVLLVQKCVKCADSNSFLFSPPRSREKYCAKCGELDRDRNSALNMRAVFVAMFVDGGNRPAYLGPDATQAAVAKRTADAVAVDDQAAVAPPTAAAMDADDGFDGVAFLGAAGACFV